MVRKLKQHRGRQKVAQKFNEKHSKPLWEGKNVN